MPKYYKYYAKYRKIINVETNEQRECYSPIIVINGEDYYVSKNDKIMEFKNMSDALDKAEEIYKKLVTKNKNID